MSIRLTRKAARALGLDEPTEQPPGSAVRAQDRRKGHESREWVPSPDGKERGSTLC
jgi:hypothetical protein